MTSVTTRGQRSIIGSIVFAVLSIPAVALAQESPFPVSIENLSPGVPQSTSVIYELPHDAVLRGLTWTGQTGVLEFADLEVDVCDRNSVCSDPDRPGDTVLQSGPVTITVTASISGEAPQDSSGTASGELAFVAADVTDGVEDAGSLPFTGVWLLQMAAWAAAMVSIGALVVVLARRRDSEEGVQ